MCLELYVGIYEGLGTFRFSRNKERDGVVKGSEFYYIAVQCYDVASVVVSRSGPLAI